MLRVSVSCLLASLPGARPALCGCGRVGTPGGLGRGVSALLSRSGHSSQEQAEAPGGPWGAEPASAASGESRRAFTLRFHLSCKAST